MRNNRLIIAVIGPTRGIESIDWNGELTHLAQAVGAEITNRQHILLTGGKPHPGVPAPIKDAAMQGAKEAGTPDKPARLVSVLPRESSVYINYASEEPSCRHLVIGTDFADGRNFINASIPDAAIAIHGGAGTLSEVAFTHEHGSPIVFLQVPGVVDTLAALKKVPELGSTTERSRRQSLIEVLEAVHQHFPLFDVCGTASKVRRYINQDKLVRAPSAASAVATAVGLASQRLVSPWNRLPHHERLASKLAEYEEAVDSLAE